MRERKTMSRKSVSILRRVSLERQIHKLYLPPFMNFVNDQVGHIFQPA
jgi:hypothetical protein